MQYVIIGEQKFSIGKLRELTKDVEPVMIPMEKIVYNIHDQIWKDKEGKFSAACVLLQRFEPRFNAHYERIAFADMSFPILVTSNYKILDGYHRFNKAKLQSQPYIKAIIVHRNILKLAKVI